MGFVINNNKFTITIDSILGGISRGYFPERENQFHASIAINPYESLGSNLPKRSTGFLMPTGYAKFSGTEIAIHPKWIIKSPKLNGNVDPFTYYYSGTKFGAFELTSVDGGTMQTADNANTPNTMPFTLSGGTPAGNGAAYYNNFVYIAKGTDVSRYGPINNATGLDASNGVNEDVWTGSELGTQTAIVDTTYPISMPNHPMHVHTDNKLYFGDVLNGQGIIHYIKTKKGTYEGDTNDGSLYNALDLPFGYLPTDIESYGKDLVILAMQTTHANVNQGNAALFFWDTFSDTFYRQIPLFDPLATSLINNNGILRIFTGMSGGGVRCSKYIGGSSVETEFIFEEGIPPFAGAVEGMGEAIVFPINITYPETAACIFTWGGKGSPFEPVLNNIGQASDQGQANTKIYSLAQVLHTQHFEVPKFVFGWYRSSTTGGLDEYSNTKSVAVYRSNFFHIGRRFQITKLSLRFAEDVLSNNTLIPKIFFDDIDVDATVTLDTINSSSATNAISFTYSPIDNAIGDHNFFIELRWSGSVTFPVQLPITIEGIFLDDEVPFNAP